MGLQFIGMFEHPEAYALRKAKKAEVQKMAASCSMVKGERLFIKISSPSAASMEKKKHWLLVIEGSTD